MYSVIIPLYNKSNYIKKAVNSVLTQSFEKFELIVVDDASTDDSLGKISEIKDERIKIVLQENHGVSAARNNGVKHSKNPFIAFLDADDWWDKKYLEEMKNLIEDFPDAGLYSSRFWIVKNNKINDSKVDLDKSFKKGYINYCSIYNKTFSQLINSSSVVIKKNVFYDVGGFSESIKKGEDLHLWVKISLGYKIAYLNKNLSFYNQDSAPEFRGSKNLPDIKSNYVYHFTEFSEHEKKIMI